MSGVRGTWLAATYEKTLGGSLNHCFSCPKRDGWKGSKKQAATICICDTGKASHTLVQAQFVTVK